ncbi:MAG TPA: NAD(P)-dependent alcohol dehydrogenase [Thermoanaerobaculaceae bacterium]|nr:NAD(P)-dependent alcohol dehydrogenase [Thermoanaerobaculaceae bacterium]
MRFHAYAAAKAKAHLKPFEYRPRPLGAHDVEIAITHCGICHSDVHLVDGEWGDWFPLVPGHEIIGTVVAGKAFRAGERVGVGWQCNSCGTCEHCRAGDEVLCDEHSATCQGNFGGFADRIRVNERFVVRIPPALASESAAPLLCGGVTVYSPLRRFAGAGTRVGVIGIGGLGHLALQFAKALGCEVTAFSRRKDKAREARRLGADHFATGKPRNRSLDLILNTAHAAPDMDAYLGALRPRGVFCQLGAAPDPLRIPAFALISESLTVTGSAIGSPSVIREMLDVAARHGIAATTEVMAMREADAALDRTRRNAARYRMVLANS